VESVGGKTDGSGCPGRATKNYPTRTLRPRGDKGRPPVGLPARRAPHGRNRWQGEVQTPNIPDP
jgi:hypothetical protein